MIQISAHLECGEMDPRDIRQPSWCRGPADRGEYIKSRPQCQLRGLVDRRDTAPCKAEDGMLELGRFRTGERREAVFSNEVGVL
jgi:hypothetical protein